MSDPRNGGVEQLLDHSTTGITRRQALRRGATGLIGASSLSTIIAACGGSSSSSNGGQSASGTINLYGYPGWYGPHEFADFHKLHPSLTVKNITGGTNGAAAQIAQLSTNSGAYDLTLAGLNVAQQMKEAGLLAPFDEGAVPNIKYVGSTFRKGFPYGIPTDFGKTGFGYRKDLISERPTSWKELWELAMTKYSGKVTMLKYDSDIQGTALRYLGYSTNTKDKGQLEAMQKALLELKPHLQAILETDYSKPLIEGTAYFAIDYDYDIAAAQEHNKEIVWVQPTEGCTAYLEGWVGVKSSKHLSAVWEFMNFHLEPKNYATFVDANGCAYVEQAAAQYIKPSISSNPSLKYDTAALKNVEFEDFLGAQNTAYRGKLWEEFLAA